MLSFQDWLQTSGLTGGSEADPYKLGDYGSGAVVGNSGLYKRNDESQSDFLQRAYQMASAPWFGQNGRTFDQLRNAGFFNEVPSNTPGYSVVGEDASKSMLDPNMAPLINQAGGPGSFQNVNGQWLAPTNLVGQMGQVNAQNNANWTDLLPIIFGMAATAGVGALGAGAAGAGAAAGEGAAGGGAGAFEGATAAGELGAAEGAGAGATAGGAGGTVGGGGGMDTSLFSDLYGQYGGASDAFAGAGADGTLGADAFAGATAGGEGSTDWLSMLAGNSNGGGSLLSKLLGGGQSGQNYSGLLGAIGSAGLGYMGAQSQANNYNALQQKYLDLGAPYRNMLQQSYQPGFNMAQADPAYQGALDQSSNSVLRKLSATGTNPFDNPGGLMEANKYVTQNTALPQLNTYRSQLGGFGQLGVNTAGTAGMNAVPAQSGTYTALGSGLAGLTNPYGNMSNPYGNMNIGLGGGF